jgi:hypothetical protein
VLVEMKMDPENFEALRRLMVVKRHEAPPPGYFNRLPGTIMTRIERGEGKFSFWERISADFTLRPAFAYAFVLAACGALTASLYSVKTQSNAANLRGSVSAGWQAGTAREAFVGGFNPAEPLHVANWLGNTNSGAGTPELPSLFWRPNRAVPVSYETRN